MTQVVRLLALSILLIASGACSRAPASGGEATSGGGSGSSGSCGPNPLESSVAFTGLESIDQITGGSVRLRWTDVAGAANYQIYDLTGGTPIYIKSVDAPADDATVNGLSPSSSYRFRVRMLDSQGRIDPNTKDMDALTLAVTTPDMISGLQVWLAADDVNGNGDGSSGHAPGSPISSWTSKVGSFVPQQATASKQPTYLSNQVNGQAALSFDGIDDVLGLTINVAESGYTFFVVFKTSDNGGAMLAVVDPVGENAGSHDRQFGMLSSKFAHRVWNQEISQSTANFNDGAPHIGAVTVGPSQGQRLYVDGTSVFTGTKTGSDFNWQTGLMIGNHSAWGAYAGLIAEVIIYGEELSPADRAEVETYLKGKYGI